MISVRITGGSGFIAGAVRARLEAFPDRYRVGCVSLRGGGWRDSGFSGWDCVVHTAGIAHVKADPALAPEYMRVNRDLTLEAARRAKADGARQFIFLSSVIVYGDPSPAGERFLIGPDTPPAPANAYGRSKLEAEEGLRALEDERFRVAVLRLPMVFGRGCKGNYNALAALARRSPVFPRFENRRGVVYVENLAEFIRRRVDAGDGGLFFPQDEIASTAGLAALVARAHGRRMILLRALNPAVRLLGRRGMVRRAFGDMAVDPALAAPDDGWRRFDLESSIRKTEIE